MNTVFDCERMKYLNTGLFEYCSCLGRALQFLMNDSLIYYIPKQHHGYFGDNNHYINVRKIDKLLSIRKTADYSIWHTTYQSSAYMPKQPKLKKVLTLHDLNFFYETKSESAHRKKLKTIQANINRADAIIAISNFARVDALKYLELNNKPIHVIYNGCIVEEFPNYVLRDLPSRPFLFTVGAILPKKNFHSLPCLLKGNDFDLYIAGVPNKNYISEILLEAKKFNVEDRVKILGVISKEDKYWFLKNCSAFLFPSLAEGFGIPIIEAMRFGKPVFLSTTTSLPEIGGEYAYYFNDFDPINMQEVFYRGMEDYKERTPSDSIIKYSKKFDWTESAKQYLAVYKSLLQ